MSEPTEKQLSRRDALKLLGAAAGASVLANLPSRWSTPQSVAGVLPAHAQGSCLRFAAWAMDDEPGQSYVVVHVEPSFVSAEGIFPLEGGLGGVFYAPKGWEVRWECSKIGCIQIHFAGQWNFILPDGEPDSATDGTVYINLGTGEYARSWEPEALPDGCKWVLAQL